MVYTLDELFPQLKKYNYLKIDEDIDLNKDRISLKNILKRFGVHIECSEKLLNVTFLNKYEQYEIDKYGRHRFYGGDQNALYEIFIDIEDFHEFLENHITRLDHSPSLIYIYNKKGEIVVMT